MFLNNGITSLPTDISIAIKDGTVLAGDDLSPNAIREWYRQEEEAFYQVDDGNSDVDPWYAYMRYLNNRICYDQLELLNKPELSILFIGPGSGIEAKEFLNRYPLSKITFLEASDSFRKKLKIDFPGAMVIEPADSGVISIDTATQDVVCAFSVLHHIANVSFILKEVQRVMSPNGFFFAREPCSSMGDWRYPRKSTPNERGLSKKFLLSSAKSAGLVPGHSPIPLVLNFVDKLLMKLRLHNRIPLFLVYCVDRLLSTILMANDHYWRDTTFRKLGPSAYYYAFRKF